MSILTNAGSFKAVGLYSRKGFAESCQQAAGVPGCTAEEGIQCGHVYHIYDQ